MSVQTATGVTVDKKEALIERYKPLIHKYAKMYSFMMPYEDAVQEGYCFLLECAQKFSNINNCESSEETDQLRLFCLYFETALKRKFKRMYMHYKRVQEVGIEDTIVNNSRLFSTEDRYEKLVLKNCLCGSVREVIDKNIDAFSHKERKAIALLMAGFNLGTVMRRVGMTRYEFNKFRRKLQGLFEREQPGILEDMND